MSGADKAEKADASATVPPQEPTEAMTNAARQFLVYCETPGRDLRGARRHMLAAGASYDSWPEWAKKEDGHITKGAMASIIWHMMLAAAPVAATVGEAVGRRRNDLENYEGGLAEIEEWLRFEDRLRTPCTAPADLPTMPARTLTLIAGLTTAPQPVASAPEPLAGVFRWIDDAVKLLKAVRASEAGGIGCHDVEGRNWFDAQGTLLSGVPCPQEDLGFGSPADKAASARPEERATWQPIETAPKNGALLRLLIAPDDDRENALEDTDQPSRTVGHNNCDHDGEDKWLFAGWNWENDYYTEGHGTPTHWRPYMNSVPCK